MAGRPAKAMLPKYYPQAQLCSTDMPDNALGLDASDFAASLSWPQRLLFFATEDVCTWIGKVPMLHPYSSCCGYYGTGFRQMHTQIDFCTETVALVLLSPCVHILWHHTMA